MKNATRIDACMMEPGDRVAVLPHHDRWMRGDRFGTVEKIGRCYIHVRLDRSGQLHGFAPGNIEAL